MNAVELYRQYRRDEILRRRRLGPSGRIAEREARIATVNWWMERWGV